MSSAFLGLSPVADRSPSPFSPASLRKRKWSHDVLNDSASTSLPSSPLHRYRSPPAPQLTHPNPSPASPASPSSPSTSLTRSPSADADDAGAAKRTRPTAGDDPPVRWVKIQVDDSGGRSVVTHATTPPHQQPPLSPPLPSSHPSPSVAERTARLLALSSPPSKSATQPLLHLSSPSVTPSRPLSLTTPIPSSSSPVAPPLSHPSHLNPSHYRAILSSLSPQRRSRARQKQRSGPPPPIQFVLPSAILARKAAALAAKAEGGASTNVEAAGGGEERDVEGEAIKEAHCIPAPPAWKREERAEVRPAPSPASSASSTSMSVPCSSPQSLSSSAVVSPVFSPYSFPGLSLTSTSSTTSSSQSSTGSSFIRRFSLPPLTPPSSLPSPTDAALPAPLFTRPRSSIHLAHPAIQHRLRHSRWRKLQMAMRLKQRWKTYKLTHTAYHHMEEGPGAPDTGRQEEAAERQREGEGEVQDDEDDDDDMGMDELIDATEDDAASLSSVSPSPPEAAPALQRPYDPYEEDNRIILALQPVVAPSSSSSRRTLSPSPAPSRSIPSQLATRRHTNPTRGSPLLDISHGHLLQAKRSAPSTSTSLGPPLSPGPVSPRTSPRSPSSASLRSRHLSLLASAPSSPLPRVVAVAAVVIDHFALCLTFQYLDLSTLLQAKAVNWLWYEHASSPLSWLYTSLHLQVMEEGAQLEPPLPLPPFAPGLPCAHLRPPPVHSLTPVFCETLAVSVRYLRALDLSSLPCALSVPSFSALLTATPFLHSLSLSYNGGWVSDSHLSALPLLVPRLRYLDLACSQLLTREGLAALHPLPLLSLDLSSCGVSDVDLEALLLLPSLLSLSLSSNQRLTPLAFSFLCHALPQLLIVDASWTSIASSPSSSSLPLLSSLLILNLSYSQHLDDDALTVIGRLRLLHTLDLFACQQLSDDGVQAMCGVQPHNQQSAQQHDAAEQAEGERQKEEEPTRLTAFPIKFAMATPRLLQSAPPSPPLLSASSTLSLPFSSFGISSRQTSPTLPVRSLVRAVPRSASPSPPTSSSALLPSLSSLSIGALPLVSALALATAVCRLPSLVSLDVQFSRMDDEGLRVIAEEWKSRSRGASRLRLRRSINVSWCKAVTVEGKQMLHDLLPDCDVA